MAHGILPIQVVASDKDDEVTSHAGLVLVTETIRALGLDEVLNQELGPNKRESTFTHSDKAQAIILLMTSGGDCIQDINVLRTDKAFQKLLGSPLPSPDTLVSFLHGFHDDALIQKAKDSLQGDAVAYIPAESTPLKALANANLRFIHFLASRLPDKARQATLDHDATIVESHKLQAKAHYKSGRGYQPVALYWVELDVVVGDEYRDGNVPAAMSNRALIEQGFRSLPACVERRFFRSDSACYDPDLLRWLTDPKRRSEGLKEPIGFAISADMTKALRSHCEAVAESEWEVVQDRTDETLSCCEVCFRPGFWKEKDELRYIAVRIQKKQGRLYPKGFDTKYLAIVTNRKDLTPVELVKWHRAKAGTIEHVHDVTKNELAAGVPPTGLFGANAAWNRLSMMSYNVLSAMKQLALKTQYAKARPKRLRFCVLTLAGKVVSHAHKLLLKVGKAAEAMAGLVDARQRLLEVRAALAHA